jgi:SET domain-containing protein
VAEGGGRAASPSRLWRALTRAPIIARVNTYDFKAGRSRIQGRGLFVLSAVDARRKMGELGGEHISQREARRRARGAECVMIVEFGDGTALDATRSDSPFKYVNHSCEPNAFMRLYHGRVEFYALRRVEAGEEVTCNYGQTHHDGKLPCRCGSPKCRGRL